jgi:NADH-quinone oxidoreductase subunit F
VIRLQQALKAARRHGLLGKNILGRNFSFDIRINRGGGAFVCGESTALMASLEGKPGEPRAKYVHTVEAGLQGKPTVLNNVETWANVPLIIGMGGKQFAAIGTERSKGTKVFSLVGKVRNTGLVEVPMGMTLREIVCDIGGGAADGKALKAVQTGGPSGGCIPERLFDTPVDYDALYELGSMMGSGGLIVMDEDTCMVNVARYFLEFLQKESCGKCTACREGMPQMLHILNRICAGEGKEGDVELLLDLAELAEDAALCGLGTTACNPVRTTIKYFREEYDAHIREKRCPAGECRGLFRYEIVAEKCKGCGLCRKECPEAAITGEPKKTYVIDQSKCVYCGMCYAACKFDAIAKV